MKSLFFSLAILFSFFTHASPPSDAAPMKDIELLWQPTDDFNEIKKIDAAFFDSKKIKIEKFVDTRKIEPKNKVGENIEDGGKSLAVYTKTDVPAFVTEHFKEVLGKVGMDVVEEGADYVISGQIREYFIEEKNTYVGSLMVQIKVSKNGKEVWSGKVTGSNKRFGRSFKLENYLQGLSDCIMDFTKEFLSNRSMADKLNK